MRKRKPKNLTLSYLHIEISLRSEMEEYQIGNILKLLKLVKKHHYLNTKEAYKYMVEIDYFPM